MHISIKEGMTFYSVDGKKSATIKQGAAPRRDRYHADYYTVAINNNGVEEYDRLSHGQIDSRFPLTEPKPETGKTYNTARQFAGGVAKVTGANPATGNGDRMDRAIRFGHTYISEHITDTDEFVVRNLPIWMEVALLEAGFSVRKVIRRGWANEKTAVDAWSK